MNNITIDINQLFRDVVANNPDTISEFELTWTERITQGNPPEKPVMYSPMYQKDLLPNIKIKYKHNG